MAQVKVTITYDYGGDYDTNAEAIAEETEAWTEGTVCVADILAAGDDGKLTVEIIGDIASEAADAASAEADEDDDDEDDEDDEKAA